MKLRNPFELDRLHASALYALLVMAVAWFGIQQFRMAFSGAGSALHLMVGSWAIFIWLVMLLPYSEWVDNDPLKSLNRIGIFCYSVLALLSTLSWLLKWYTAHATAIKAIFAYQVNGVRVSAVMGWIALGLISAGAVYWDLLHKPKVDARYLRAQNNQ